MIYSYMLRTLPDTIRTVLPDKVLPVIGSYCTYFPKEITMAMGTATVSLCSTSDETIPAAEKDLPQSQKAEVLDLWKAEILRFKEYLEKNSR